MIEYTLQGGDEGANRLDILSNTLQLSTENFLKTLGIHEGANCLDLGCGTGRVTCIIAKIIGNRGNVLGLDINEKNIQLAVESAKAKAIKNVNFKYFDAYLLREKFVYDVIYSRFLLSHLTNPKKVLQNTLDALKPGGLILIEDTDFAGHFSNPKSDDFNHYINLYERLLRTRRADANIGQKLVWLLNEVGFTEVKFQISQPVHISGKGKLMAEITFKAVSESLVEEGFITESEAIRIYSSLVQFRKRGDTMMSLPRIFQVSAKKAF